MLKWAFGYGNSDFFRDLPRRLTVSGRVAQNTLAETTNLSDRASLCRVGELVCLLPAVAGEN